VTFVTAYEVGQGIFAKSAKLGIGCLRGLEENLMMAVRVKLIERLFSQAGIVLAIQICAANADDALAPKLLRLLHL